MANSKKLQVIKRADDHCGLQQLPEFHLLPKETCDDLRRICTVHELPAGETLAYQGDEVRWVYFVKRGLLRMQKQLIDGRVHIVALLPLGHIVGAFFLRKHVFSIEAATPAEVISFEAAQFRSIVSSSPELQRILYHSVQCGFDASLNWLMLFSNIKVRERLAGFLIILLAQYSHIPNLIDKKSEALRLHVPISRIDLANILGVRPESLSRAFHMLEDDGLIEIIKPDQILILDIEGLALEVSDPDLVEKVPDDWASKTHRGSNLIGQSFR